MKTRPAASYRARLGIATLWVLLTLGGPGRAADGNNDRVNDGLHRAVQYLLSQQDLATGGIHNKMRNETAMTALSILALGSCGHQPGDATPEGKAIRGPSLRVMRSRENT